MYRFLLPATAEQPISTHRVDRARRGCLDFGRSPPSNIFVDFGLYDVPKPYNVTPNPAWADSFANDKEFGHFGVWFFDYLSGNDGDKMRSLPTGKEGPNSDYL